jgi:ATP-dependent DNA helicase PIF1
MTKLSISQKKVYDSYINGDNVFMTGPGGTGKTHLIRMIYDHSIKNNKNISITALTGVASLLLECNSTTIHTWSGIGIAKGEEENIIKKVCNNKFKKVNWLNTDILVIDEISMMSSKIFNILDKIGRKLKDGSKPFGGIQVIFSGDFFQLPPVNESTFCFQNENFLSTFNTVISLTKIYRQNNKDFQKILLNMRHGKITKAGLESLNTRLIDNLSIENKTEINSNICRLVPTKQKANKINESFLSKLEGNEFCYKRCYTENKTNITKINALKLDLMTEEEKENEYKYIENNTLTEDKLILKKGALVMCIANLDIITGVVNGSQGVVENFNTLGYPIIKFKNTTVTICKKSWDSDNIPGLSINQLPLILAWGITIHKAQGITLENAIIDIGNDIFETGQMYVALSRLKNLDGLYLQNLDISKLKINADVLNFYKQNNLLN